MTLWHYIAQLIDASRKEWPQMHADSREYLNGLAEKVVGAAFEVANVLGPRFLEKVYERAMVAELTMRGIRVRPQAPISVVYKGNVVGDYFADLLVEEILIVELKYVEALGDEHLAQCLNYLKATGRQLALMMNFRRNRLEWKRVVLDF
jgi:GxxExxY protein